MNVIYNSIFLDHETGNHPENKTRLKYFENYPQTEVPDGRQYLELAHTKEYIKHVQAASANGTSLDPDTPICTDTFRVACHAVGATILATQTGSFAVIRPPGHHACKDQGMGFCIFNNMAIAAKYLSKQNKKIFILDIDIHHGNGTEDIVKGDKNILFASLHQVPLYPGTGMISSSNCIDIPLRFGTKDADYIEMLDSSIKQAIQKFKPDIIGVSAGFDSYFRDFQYMNPAAGFKLTEKSLNKVKELIAPYPHFMVLEGGYNPESIRDGVAVFSDEYRRFLETQK